MHSAITRRISPEILSKVLPWISSGIPRWISIAIASLHPFAVSHRILPKISHGALRWIYPKLFFPWRFAGVFPFLDFFRSFSLDSILKFFRICSQRFFRYSFRDFRELFLGSKFLPGFLQEFFTGPLQVYTRDFFQRWFPDMLAEFPIGFLPDILPKFIQSFVRNIS